jgi:hypothetical protein
MERLLWETKEVYGMCQYRLLTELYPVVFFKLPAWTQLLEIFSKSNWPEPKGVHNMKRIL